jgi:hypothetical protein
MNPTSCLFGSRFELRSFPPNRAQKMQERHHLFFGLRLVSKGFQHPAIQTKIEQHFKPMQTLIRTSRRLDSFLHEVAKNFEVFSNIQE